MNKKQRSELLAEIQKASYKKDKLDYTDYDFGGACGYFNGLIWAADLLGITGLELSEAIQRGSYYAKKEKGLL